MTPDYKTLLRGSTTWREQHRNIAITLSHHGYNDGSLIGSYRPETHPGTWCYYLHLTEQMFFAEDWTLLSLPPKEAEWGITYDYHLLPEMEFHGGCTFYEKDWQWDRHKKGLVEVLKIGCDYNHSWDRDGYYSDNYASVLCDAHRSVNALLSHFPKIRLRCAYSGRWDEAEAFYTAKNGATVHRSCEEDLRKDLPGWANWLPVQEAA